MLPLSRSGTVLLAAAIVLLIFFGTATSLFVIASAGAKREALAHAKSSAREIAETGMGLSLANLRQATDGADNDGDGAVDEGIAFDADLFDPAVTQTIEGRLGRIGTLLWTRSDDVNGNGYPDFEEPNVTPMEFAGGQLLVHTLFSQRDGLDNDGDGLRDEPDEAGFLTVVALGRYDGDTRQVRTTGRFRDLFAPPGSPWWTPSTAMLTGGSLKVAGNAAFFGTYGGVHANGFLSITGTPLISRDATASGGLAVSGRARIQGFSRPDAPRVPLPDVRPAALRFQADYILAAGGKVTDACGWILHDAATGGPFNGWSHLDDGWHFSGNGQNPPSIAGTYFVEGDALIVGTGQGATVGRNAAGQTQVVSMTVIATGSIHVTGSSRLVHDRPDGLLLVAGGDVRLTGTPGLEQRLEGLVAAREQIHVSGTPEICGALVAQDAARINDLNAENLVPGTPDITCNGSLEPRIPALDPDRPWFVLDPEILSVEER